jgi:hypothetical protein
LALGALEANIIDHGGAVPDWPADQPPDASAVI